MWQKIKKRFFNPPRRIRLTPDGWKFLIITFLLGFAAINTGTNALYLLASMLLSLIIASGILSDIAIRNLKITLYAPRYIFARQNAPITVKVFNNKKKISSYLINIKPGKKSNPELFYSEIAPCEEKERILFKTFEKRGYNNLQGYILSTFYPFSLFEKYTPYPEITRVVVFPAIRDVKGILKETGGLKPESNKYNRQFSEQAEEFQQVRDYIPSDSSRVIYWKKSTQKLMSKKFETNPYTRYSIIFDRSCGAEDSVEFETNIELAASVAYYLAKNNMAFSFYSQGFEIKETNGEKDIEKILEWLALTTPLETDAETIMANGNSVNKIVITCNKNFNNSEAAQKPALKESNEA